MKSPYQEKGGQFILSSNQQDFNKFGWRICNYNNYL